MLSTKMMDWHLRKEEFASRHINIASHYDDTTLQDKSGKLIKIIKLQGIDAITQDEKTLDIFKNRRNNLLKSFSSEFAIYFWQIRSKKVVFPGGEFQEGFAKSLNEKYKKVILNSELYQNDLYLAVMTKPASGVINWGFNFLKWLRQRFIKSEMQKFLTQQHESLCNVVSKVLSSLSDYKPTLLSVYEKNNVLFSEPLTLLSELLNFNGSSVPLEIAHADQSLPRYRLSFDNRAGIIKINFSDGREKFAAMLSLKDYPPFTFQGMLDEINTLKIPYVITQSIRPYDRHVTKTRLRDQQKEMRQTKEESVTQTEQISEAFDDAASGEVGYGAHHLSIACFADSQEELNQYIATIVSKFSDLDMVCIRETISCESAFWAQLPGNFKYINRKADISTKNMAALISLHNTPTGTLKGNHWGDAVTVLETIAHSPYYFNFHQKDVGNFLIFGSMGSGKTLLTGFLIAQSMKFGGKRVIFDKDRGLEGLVRATRGVYDRIKPGIATGFNPCQLPDTTENRKFLSTLFKKMVSINNEVVSEYDMTLIENAIHGMYRLEPRARQLCHIASFFGTKKIGSLRNRFDQWHSLGAHAWVFDNAEDTLNLAPDVIGFDIGDILADQDCKTPALMYLIYRVGQALEDHRGLLFVDEGWLALNDLYFSEVLKEWARTPRKKNNIFGMATQVVNDVASFENYKAIIESAAVKIFFPNPSADRNVYINQLGLREKEYDLIKKMPDDQHYFLLIHGKGANRESVIAKPYLLPLKPEIALISGRESTIKLIDNLCSEFGNIPDRWVPRFNEMVSIQ